MMWTMISITDIENEKGKLKKGDWLKGDWFNYYTITVNTTTFICDQVCQWLAVGL